MTQEWNPPVHMTTTTKAGASSGEGMGRMRWFDKHGEMSPERIVLREILSTLQRIEALLQKQVSS